MFVMPGCTYSAEGHPVRVATSWIETMATKGEGNPVHQAPACLVPTLSWDQSLPFVFWRRCSRISSFRIFQLARCGSRIHGSSIRSLFCWLRRQFTRQAVYKTPTVDGADSKKTIRILQQQGGHVGCWRYGGYDFAIYRSRVRS